MLTPLVDLWHVKCMNVCHPVNGVQYSDFLWCENETGEKRKKYSDIKKVSERMNGMRNVSHPVNRRY